MGSTVWVAPSFLSLCGLFLCAARSMPEDWPIWVWERGIPAAVWSCLRTSRPGVQVRLRFVYQGLFHRYPAVLVALAVHVNDTALICRSDVADVGAHELVRA